MVQSNYVEWNKLFLDSVDPFSNVIVRNAWDDSINKFDVKSINSEATNLVLRLLTDVKKNSFSTACLIQGQPGIGKSHFLGRLRELSSDNNFLFVSINPISDITSIFNHIYKEIFYSLRKKNISEKFAPIDFLISSILTKTIIKAVKQNSKILPLIKNIDNLIQEMEKDQTLLLHILETDPDTLDVFYSISEKAINLVEQDYPNTNVNLLIVLFKYLNPDLRAYAIRWLQGDDVSQEYLTLLGVTESINTESIAQSVLYSLMHLSQKPFLLCFDQFESIYDRFRDIDLLISFFDTIVRICNETSQILVLLMVQSAVWTGSIEPNLQRSALDRIEFRESLKTPALDELSELVALRLKPIYSVHPYPPENPIYPFTIKYLEEIAIMQGWNPRSILKVLSQTFQKIKIEQALDFISNTNSSEIIIEDQNFKTKEEFISDLFKSYSLAYSDDLNENTFFNRENFLKLGIYDILVNLINLKDVQYTGFKVENVVYKKKKKDFDILFTTLDEDKKEEKWGLIICNSEDHLFFGKLLKKIHDNLENKTITRWVMLRDIHLPIKSTWRTIIASINELLNTGRLIFVDQTSASNIVALKEILDAVSIGDLQYQHNFLKRDDVINYFFNEILPKISLIFKILSKLDSKSSVDVLKEKSMDTGMLTVDEENKMIQNLSLIANDYIIVNPLKNIKDYVEKKDIYDKIFNTLSKEKKIFILNKDQNIIIKEEDNVF